MGVPRVLGTRSPVHEVPYILKLSLEFWPFISHYNEAVLDERTGLGLRSPPQVWFCWTENERVAGTGKEGGRSEEWRGERMKRERDRDEWRQGEDGGKKESWISECSNISTVFLGTHGRASLNSGKWNENQVRPLAHTFTPNMVPHCRFWAGKKTKIWEDWILHYNMVESKGRKWDTNLPSQQLVINSLTAICRHYDLFWPFDFEIPLWHGESSWHNFGYSRAFPSLVRFMHVKPWFHVKIKLSWRILGMHGTTSEMK